MRRSRRADRGPRWASVNAAGGASAIALGAELVLLGDAQRDSCWPELDGDCEAAGRASRTTGYVGLATGAGAGIVGLVLLGSGLSMEYSPSERASLGPRHFNPARESARWRAHVVVAPVRDGARLGAVVRF